MRRTDAAGDNFAGIRSLKVTKAPAGRRPMRHLSDVLRLAFQTARSIAATKERHIVCSSRHGCLLLPRRRVTFCRENGKLALIACDTRSPRLSASLGGGIIMYMPYSVRCATYANLHIDTTRRARRTRARLGVATARISPCNLRAFSARTQTGGRTRHLSPQALLCRYNRSCKRIS